MGLAVSNQYVSLLNAQRPTKSLRFCLALLVGLASPAFGQSMYKCSEAGRTWHQNNACAITGAHDRTLRKCVAANGAVSIQNEPCPAKAKTAWVRGTEPEVVTAETLRRQAGIRRQQEANSRYLSRLAGTDRTNGGGYTTSTASESQRAACERAKRHRQSVLDQVGLKRTHDLLRALDQEVYRACPRGP